MKKIKQSGIYSIRCVPSEKVYIGSSIDILRRWYEHRFQLAKGVHANMHLQSAWSKYGADSFVFDVIELVAPDLLLDREQHWMDETCCYDQDYGYNISEAAGRVVGDTGAGRPAHDEKPTPVSVTLPPSIIAELRKINTNLSEAIRTVVLERNRP